MPPQDQRAALVKGWNQAAEGWARQQLAFDRAAAPVASRIVELARLEPGERVLELASGLGDTGLVAAAKVGPSGSVVLSDAAPKMLDRLRDRVKGSDHIEVKELFAEGLKFDTACVDAVLCRWGYMLLLDPVSALQETRRVLAPGGRVSLAAWTSHEDNPWTGATLPALGDRGLTGDPTRPGPQMFAWADPSLIVTALEDAGFFDITVEQVDMTFEYASFDDWWDARLDLSPDFAARIGEISPEERDELTEDLEREVRPWLEADGSLRFPGRTHVAAADV
ncbi:MAG: methyltransferase domain-containing protein [Solirubrobacteraceae bacterium]|nr:methyltransferase domain-containing protein [Solirubrobacteraceae bacterium]